MSDWQFVIALGVLVTAVFTFGNWLVLGSILDELRRRGSGTGGTNGS